MMRAEGTQTRAAASVHVEGFGCRPIAAMGLARWPASGRHPAFYP
jgi:hypothetical protein